MGRFLCKGAMQMAKVAVAELDFSLIEQWSEAAAPYLKDYLEKDIPEV